MKTPLKIFLLEDLDTFYEAICAGLAQRSSELGEAEITRVSTELEYRRQLESGALVRARFDVAIFDVMVSWYTPEEADTRAGGDPPPEVQEELLLRVPWRAGVRCRRMFAEALAAAGVGQVPSIYYTVLEPEDLREVLTEETPLVVKHGDIDSLVLAIKRAIGRK
jgi:hypothetical protein